jgi:hypothetical protein
VVEWLTLQLRIREILVSNLGPILTEGFRGFPQPLEASARIVPQVTPPLILPHPLQFIIHLSSVHSTLYSLRQWESVVNQTTNKYSSSAFLPSASVLTFYFSYFTSSGPYNCVQQQSERIGLLDLSNQQFMNTKAIPLHATEARRGGTRGIAPTHSRPRH